MIFSRDTDREAERVLVDLLRRKSPAEKLAMIDDAWRTLRALHLAGIAQRHPDLTEAEILAMVAELLDRLAIPYAVGGSFASSLHGAARATRDADLIVDLDAPLGETLADALEGGFYVSREAMRQAIRTRTAFNAI